MEGFYISSDILSLEEGAECWKMPIFKEKIKEEKPGKFDRFEKSRMINIF